MLSSSSKRTNIHIPLNYCCAKKLRSCQKILASLAYSVDGVYVLVIDSVKVAVKNGLAIWKFVLKSPSSSLIVVAAAAAAFFAPIVWRACIDFMKNEIIYSGHWHLVRKCNVCMLFNWTELMVLNECACAIAVATITYLYMYSFVQQIQTVPNTETILIRTNVLNNFKNCILLFFFVKATGPHTHPDNYLHHLHSHTCAYTIIHIWIWHLVVCSAHDASRASK